MKTPDDRAAKRKGNVKARRMWHLHYADADTLHHTEREAQKIADKCEHFDGYPPGKKPVFVLPADAASYERMVEQMAKASYHADYCDGFEPGWTQMIKHRGTHQFVVDAFRIRAKAALAAIGISAPRREGRGA